MDNLVCGATQPQFNHWRSQLESRGFSIIFLLVVQTKRFETGQANKSQRARLRSHTSRQFETVKTKSSHQKMITHVAWVTNLAPHGNLHSPRAKPRREANVSNPQSFAQTTCRRTSQSIDRSRFNARHQKESETAPLVSFLRLKARIQVAKTAEVRLKSGANQQLARQLRTNAGPCAWVTCRRARACSTRKPTIPSPKL